MIIEMSPIMLNFFSFKFILLLSLVTLSGCKNLELFQSKEIKGTLSIDKSAAGNSYLEVWDQSVKDHRFIHPGRKILSIEASRAFIVIKIMDSRRVLLSTVKVDKKKVRIDENSLFISGYDSGQNWDLIGKRISHLLSTEYYPTRNSKKCNDSNEIQGHVWQVLDNQYEYLVQFRNAGSEKVWGEMRAFDGVQTDTKKVNLDKKCTPIKTVHQKIQEIFI
jgi:hypothetical protein